jgi:Flp pilus assembly protein TadD
VYGDRVRSTLMRRCSLTALLTFVAAVAAVIPAAAATLRATYHEALARARAGDLDAAEARLRSVLQTDRQDVHARILLELIGDRRELRLDEDAFASTLDGIARANGRDRRGARQAFESALEIQPGYAPVLRDLGRLLMDEGDNDGAISILARARALDPDDPITENNLGLAFGWAGNHDVAIGHFQNAIDLDPAYKSAAHNLGWSLRAVGRELEARAQYARALELDPDSEITLGNILAGSDRTEAVARDPEAIAELVASIRAGNTRTRTNAVAELARTTESGPAALPLLRDREAMVRIAAVSVFRKAPYADAVGPLTALLARDPDSAVRTEAAYALQHAADTRASAALIRAVGADRAENVRAASAWALARHPGCATARALRAAQRDRIVMVRRSAGESVARLGGGAARVDPNATDPWLAKVCSGESAPLR